MGLEANCKVTHKRKTFDAAVHVEADSILIRGAEIRLKLLTADLTTVEAKADTLLLESAKEGSVKLALSAEKTAIKWRDKILNPPTRMDKIGLKPGMTYWAQGEFDAEFQRSLNPALAKPAAQADMLFVEVNASEELQQAAVTGSRMASHAAIWIVYPKGKQSPFRENEVFTVMRAAGLTDNKVCSFNERLTALKFVVPKAKR